MNKIICSEALQEMKKYEDNEFDIVLTDPPYGIGESNKKNRFPLDYEFVGTHTNRCKQVGNAVPVPLAQSLAKSCKESLKKYYKRKIKVN